MPEIGTKLPGGITVPACESYPAQAPDVKIRLPFGITLANVRASMDAHVSTSDMLMGFVGQIQPSLSPFMNVLVLADAAKTLFDCINAIKKAVSRLSVGPIIECLRDLAKVLPQLVQLVPPISYVGPVIDITLTAALLMDALIEQLLTAVVVTAEISGDFSVDLGLNPALETFGICIGEDSQLQLDALAQATRTISPLFNITGTLLGLIDLPGISKFVQPIKDVTALLGDLQATDITADLEPDLRDVQALLRELVRVLNTLG